MRGSTDLSGYKSSKSSSSSWFSPGASRIMGSRDLETRRTCRCAGGSEEYSDKGEVLKLIL